MTPINPRPIVTPEQVYQFTIDFNQERQRELRLEDACEKMAQGYYVPKFN